MGKKNLSKRYNYSHQTKDSGGIPTIFNLPGDVKFYKAEKGNGEIDIVPFIVKTKNHPLVKMGEMEIGDWDYVMDIWVHRNVGPGDVDVVCLKKNYRKACPVCELADEYKEQGKEEEYKAIKASRRVYYNVIDATKESGEILVFGVSHYLFEKELIEEARASTKDKEAIDFADIENGNTVCFRASPDKIEGNEFLKFKSFKFEKREFEITEDDVKDAISFDEYLKIYTIEEIEKIIYGKDEDDNDPDGNEPKRKRRREKPEGIADDEPVDKESKRKRKREKSEDDNTDSEGSERKRRKRTSEDTEKVEEKKTRGRGKSKKQAEDECPSGYKFGIECDKKKECDKCDVWDACSDAHEE